MKKRIVISSVLFAVILSAALFAAFGLPKETAPIPERLSAEKTAELREGLPISSSLPETVSIIVPPLDFVINNLVDTYVHAKVLSPIPDYPVHIEDVNYSRTHMFFGYELEIISDNTNMFRKGETISTVSNVIMKDMYPELIRGDEILAAISNPVEGHGDNYGISALGMFYVIEGGYCFSTYDMEDAIALDGIHVDELMSNQLRKR